MEGARYKCGSVYENSRKREHSSTAAESTSGGCLSLGSSVDGLPGGLQEARGDGDARDPDCGGFTLSEFSKPYAHNRGS